MYNRISRIDGAVANWASVLTILATLLMAAELWTISPAHAVEQPTLYTAEVPFDSDDPDANRSAYRLALTAVLVRMTGSTDAAESEELQALFPNPERFVRQFRRSSPATLEVSFNGAEIERLLRQTGAPVWTADRPLTVVWLAVDWGQGRRELIGADQQRQSPAAAEAMDQNRLLRERVEAVATRRGAPVVFPLLDAQDRERIGFSDVWGGFDELLVTASQRYGASSILVGRIRPETARAHRWTWYRDGQRVDWRGEPEEVLNQLADSLASSDALPGNQEGEFTQLTISGVNSVRAYGRVQNFLESLRVLDQLRIETVAADKITYAVEIRGGAERLRAALASSNFLIPAEASSFDRNPFNGRVGASDRGPFGDQERPVSAGRALDYIYREIATRQATKIPL